jgi:hypothetical protein
MIGLMPVPSRCAKRFQMLGQFGDDFRDFNGLNRILPNTIL